MGLEFKQQLSRKDSSLRFAIVGLGSIGRRHLRNLAALGYRDIIAVSQNICQLPKNDLPAFLSYSSIENALLQNPDAVFICNPTALHLDTAIRAARAGCHIFIEKPISHSMQDVELFREIAEVQSICVQTGFQFRFHPLLQTIKKMIGREQYGRLISVHAHWGEYLPGWHPWEDYRKGYAARAALGGGVVNTLCHPFDYLRWLVGDVQQLYASGGQLSSLETDTEDVALINLQFQNGVIGSVYLDYVQQAPRHEVRFIFEEATVEWDGLRNSVHISEGKLSKSKNLYTDESFERNQLFREEVRAFVDSIRDGRPIACTLDDGIAALRITMAARQSMLEKRAIRLDEATVGSL